MPFPESVGEIVRREQGKIIASLVRMTRSIGRAEDACSDASIEALRHWPERGIPTNPGAWLMTVARRKALDTIRRESTRDSHEVAAVADLRDPAPLDHHSVRDDQLRLIFLCCHPALSAQAQVPLALRLVCGLTTAEIAAGLMETEATIGKRITRAKAKIAAAGMSARLPSDGELVDRIRVVLATVALVFTTGHHAPNGPSLVRVDLTAEAIRLAELLCELMPDEPECVGLLALQLSADARHAGRVDRDGAIIVLKDVDRSKWDRDKIDRAVQLAHMAMRRGRIGSYQLQAAISCLHAVAPELAVTDWQQIVTLYDRLCIIEPSPAVHLNRALAIAELRGAQAGMDALEPVADDTPHIDLARADLYRRLGLLDDATSAYQRAIVAAGNEPERKHLVLQLQTMLANELRADTST